MPFTFRFAVWNVKLNPEQKEKAKEIEKKYNGKLIQNREELIKVRGELSDELYELTGKRLYKTDCKYGSHVMYQLGGLANSLADSALTPEERNKWEGIAAEIDNLTAEGKIITGDADKSSPLSSWLESDVSANSVVDFYPEEIEKKTEELIKKVSAAAKEELKKAPLTGGDYNNNAFRRDSLEILVGLTDCALNGKLQEESAKTDDYLMVNSYGGLIPGMGKYGVGTKPASLPYISDYARFEHLVPLQTPVVKGMRLVNANIEYQKKGAKATRDDELKIREQILIEGADELYAIDKLRKNIDNERVKQSFPKEVEKAHKDSVGDRGQLGKIEGVQRARRELVVNGWTVSDINAVGQLAALIPIIDSVRKNTDALWDNYERYQQRVREYEEKVQRGEQARKPIAQDEPDSPRFTAEENEALRNLTDKINTLAGTAPGNEGRRNELLNSLIEEIDKLPAQTKDRFSMLNGMVEELKRAADHQLTAAEKEILADPSDLKKTASLHPVRVYTDEEQQKDLKWLEDVEAKDKELNDIFKTDPYAHDKIRELQAMTEGNPGLIAQGVKKALGQKAWDSFEARPGRTSDEEKAIDILTHKDSPYNVSKNHKTLNDLEKAVRERIIEIPKKNASSIGRKEFTSIISRLAYAIPTISPGYDADKRMVELSLNAGNESAFDRQNEYIERLNKVLDSPGNLTNAQQRDEIGICLMEILGPLSAEANDYEEDIEGLFNKENLSPKEKKEIEKKYTTPFGIPAGLMSSAYAEKVMPILKVVDKALDRAESLMISDGHVATAINIKPIQSTIKSALKGTSAMKINAMDPVIKIPDANFANPVGLHIDRDEKNPLIPGETKKFSIEEIEEKAEVFPIHKAINADFELKAIWGEYLEEREKGPLSPEREKEYWTKIDKCYTTLETVINDLEAKQKADPTFADNNMRNMVGQTTPTKSFEDTITDSRGMKGDLVHIKGRREAVKNGWPLGELGLYSHLETVARRIEENIKNVEAGGDATRDYAAHLKELKEYLNNNILNKPYEKDPEKRADLYSDAARRVHDIFEKEEYRGHRGFAAGYK